LCIATSPRLPYRAPGMADFLAHCRLLHGLAAPDLEAILAAATARRFEPHAIVTHQGAPANELFLITKGRARHSFATADGQKIVMRWLAQGELFGAAALLSEPSTYRLSTETVKDTSVLVWDRTTIRTFAERQPRLLENALWIGSDYVDWYLTAHVALSCHSARQRLASVLVSLSEVVGHPVPGGIELDVTNEELASAAHITSFTASRLLNEWQRDRAIIKRRGKVLLRAPAQLLPRIA
jgi:CRP/FNR family transcriptional regulator, nitrogen oxide reductase regulator